MWLNFCLDRHNKKRASHKFVKCPYLLAPQVRLELTTLRLTAECSAIELLRNNGTPRIEANYKIKKLCLRCQVFGRSVSR